MTVSPTKRRKTEARAKAKTFPKSKAKNGKVILGDSKDLPIDKAFLDFSTKEPKRAEITHW